MCRTEKEAVYNGIKEESVKRGTGTRERERERVRAGGEGTKRKGRRRAEGRRRRGSEREREGLGRPNHLMEPAPSSSYYWLHTALCTCGTLKRVGLLHCGITYAHTP